MSYMQGIDLLRTIFFSSKNRFSKILFSNPFPKNAQFVNLKNPDLDLIQRIHPECGFYGFMIRFWIRKSGSGFSQKNAPTVSVYEHITFIIHDHSNFSPFLIGLNTTANFS